MTKSAPEAIFNSLPVCIEILNISLQVTQRIYLLGHQPKAIQDSISKEGINSKKVKHLFEFKDQTIQGGAVDWEDLDDEDFETIINADPVVVEPIESVESNTVQSINTSERFDYSIEVFQEDTIIDLQKKIALVTKIDPAKQYLAIDQTCITHRIDFQSGFDSHMNQADLITFIQTCKTKIKDIPIDEDYILTKYSAVVTNTQADKLSTLMNGHTSLTVTVLSLDTIIPDKSVMQFLSRSDKQSFELIFESVVERFFISMTVPLFAEYLANHELEFDSGRYKTIIDKQTKLITHLNQLPKVTSDAKYLTITTNAITLRSKGIQTESNRDPMMILPKLFNSFVVLAAKGVFYVDLFMVNNNRLMQVRKVSKYAAQAINFVEGISMNIKPLASSVREYLIRDRIVITLLPSSNFSKLVISIDMFGQTEITALSNRTTEITKKLFISDLTISTKHILEYINGLSNAFISPLRLDTHLQNYKMIKSTSNLIFNQRIDYDSVVKYMISDLVASDILGLELVSNIKMKTRSFLVDRTQINKLIRVAANARLAVFTLVDLSIEETAFYVDLIGRFVKHHASSIDIKLNQSSGVQSSDPVLFKYKSKTNTNYSRVCQKRFQPILSEASDSKAYKYHNFTFDEPQYYKCPTKDNPFLGLLSGYHPSGYCLPCCRKQEQPNREEIVSNCILGKPIEEQPKVNKSSKYYIIDYPNDLIANNRLTDRVSNVPDFINKMLTRGSKLLVDGVSVSYAEPDLPMQMINILAQYLHKKSGREFILDLLEYLKDKSNHRKVLAMSNIGYTFDSISHLSSAIAERFLKHTHIGPAQILPNWNDIIIDLAICSGIGIVLLSDNRIKASDCAHVVGQVEECSDEPVTTNNASIKLLKLEYLDFDRSILMILRRVDTEYSKVNNNRRYFYYPIMSGVFTEPKIEAMQSDTTEQLKKIKSMTQQQATVIIDRGFTSQSLVICMKSIGKVRALYIDADNQIAYGEIVVNPTRSLLFSLYRSPISYAPDGFDLKKCKPGTYSGTIYDMIKVLEKHNQIQLQGSDITDFQTYLSINANRLLSAYDITLPSTNQCLLKIDKFIIHAGSVVGTKVCAVYERTCMHTLIVYHKPTSFADIVKVLAAKKNDLSKLLLLTSGRKLSKENVLSIAITGLDMIHRTHSIAPQIEQLSPFAEYFVEYKMDPLQLIDCIPESINYPTNDTLKQAQYMSNIYKIMINAMILYWKSSAPTDLIQALSQLIKSTKPDILRMMSNNLLEDWIDQLSEQFADRYHPNVISAELYEFGTYVQARVHTKTKDSVAAVLSAPDLSLNNIELHNLAYARKEQIKQLILDAASKCLVQTDSVPEIDSKYSDNIFEQYRDKSGKLPILKSIYSSLLDLALADLSNPFRREYVLANCMINSFANSVKIKSHIDELIYMQEL